jgi:hypothetical protein
MRIPGNSSLGPTVALVRRSVVLWLLLTPIWVSAGAAADSPRPPPRNANIYGGLDHQPTRSEVENRERRLGIAPGSSGEAAQNSTVEHLYDELEQRARTD